MKHKIITFGELMLRLSPDNNERFTQDVYKRQAISSGTLHTSETAMLIVLIINVLLFTSFLASTLNTTEATINTINIT